MKHKTEVERPSQDPGSGMPLSGLSAADQELLKAVHKVRFGSVEVTIHDSRVVQVEQREKVRFHGAKE